MVIWLINRMRALRGLAARFRILAILLLVLIFGSIAFYYFENGEKPVEDIWDAVYWVMVTITTVGYGDITPKTTGGRITFALVALGGIGTIAYMIEQLVSFSTKGQLRKLFGSGVMKMKKHTVIVGWNARAEEAIKELKTENNDFLVVGSQLNQVELDTLNIPHISGDATKNETLNRCNIKDAKTIMIPLENDSETVMIALAARRLNPGIKIVATCETREHVEMMRGAGIEHIISHAEIGGRLLAHAVTEPVVMKFIINAMTSAGGFNLEQIKVNKKAKLSDISLKENRKVLALYKDDRFVFDFTVDVILEKEDYLVVISSSC
jgi:voltage-gated potassium channel